MGLQLLIYIINVATFSQLITKILFHFEVNVLLNLNQYVATEDVIMLEYFLDLVSVCA